MALISCPECGNSVSDKAKACPKCGFPIEAIENQVVEEKPLGSEQEQVQKQVVQNQTYKEPKVNTKKAPTKADKSKTSIESVERLIIVVVVVVFIICAATNTVIAFIPNKSEGHNSVTNTESSETNKTSEIISASYDDMDVSKEWHAFKAKTDFSSPNYVKESSFYEFDMNEGNFFVTYSPEPTDESVQITGKGHLEINGKLIPIQFNPSSVTSGKMIPGWLEYKTAIADLGNKIPRDVLIWMEIQDSSGTHEQTVTFKDIVWEDLLKEK